MLRPSWRRFVLAAFAQLASLSLATNVQAQQRPVTLNLDNRTPGSVQVFWITPDGREEPYGTLKPGDAQVQQTFTGHRWIFRGPKGEVLSRLTANKSQEVRFEPVSKPGIPARPQAPASVAGEQTNVIWRNQLVGGVEILWVGDNNKETSYGILKAGSEMPMTTTVGHTFLFRDPFSKKEVFRSTVSGSNQTVTLGGRPNTDAADPFRPNGPQQGNPMTQSSSFPLPNDPGVTSNVPVPIRGASPASNLPVPIRPSTPATPGNPGPASGGSGGPPVNSQLTYWMGIPAPGDPNTYVFSVRVPQDVATKVIGRNDAKAPLFRTFQREIGGKTYKFFENDLVWEATAINNGSLSYNDPGAAGFGITWDQVQTSGDWPQFRKALEQIAKPLPVGTTWYQAKPQIVAVTGTPATPLQVSMVAPFDTAGAPSEQSSFHSAKPQIVAAPVNGGLIVGWRDYVGGRVRSARVTRFRMDEGGILKVWEKTLPLPVLGGVTTDGTNAYALCARDEDLNMETSTLTYRPYVLQLVKYGPEGDVLWTQDLNNERYLGPAAADGTAANAIYSPMTAGTGQLQYGNGRLLVALACNTLPDGAQRHQRAIFLVVNEDGSGSQTFTQSSWRHSFDQRVMFDGTDFVISEVADAGWYMPGAGIAVRKAKPNGSATQFAPSAAEGAYIYARLGNGDQYSNTSFTSLGDIAVGDRGYAALFASQRNNGAPPLSGFESPVPEPRNLAMVHLVKGFENVTLGYQPNKIDITRDLVDSNGPSQGPISRPNQPGKTFNQAGVVWLTNHTSGISVERPHLVKVGSDRYIALWEEWTYQGTGQNLRHQSTKAMLVGEYGNILRPATVINARLNPVGAGKAFTFGTSAAWLTGEGGTGKLRLQFVTDDLNLSTLNVGS